MQFSHLTFYCFCVLATIYKWGILLKVAAKEKEQKNCIVARVCILAGVGRASDCVERIFTSKNASDVGLHLSMETCVPGRQPLPDIGWFMERPVQRWIGQCWNRVQCRVGVEASSRQVWIGIVLRMRKDIHRTLVPQACSVTVTSHTGQVGVFQGKDRDLGCWGEGISGTLADRDTSRVLWTLPVRVHHNFEIYTTQRRQGKFRDRDKRDTMGKNVDFLSPTSGNTLHKSKSGVKDIIFSDFGDSSDVFTGELTPDEEIWNAGLPETLSPVMTFPDDYMARLFLAETDEKKTKGINDVSKQTAASLKGKGLPFLKESLLPRVGELPQFSPTNNLLPMRTVQEEAEEEAPPALPPQDLEGRDMMMALEENIDNRLYSSLSSLLQDKQTHNKEELSLVAGLALENKVSDVLSAVEKEPNPALSSFTKQSVFQQQGLKDGIEQEPASEMTENEDHAHSQIRAGGRAEGAEGDDNHTKVETPAESLPPPDRTISSINKPRPPPKNATMTKGRKEPSLNSTQTNSSISPSNNTTINTNLPSSNTVISSSPVNDTWYSADQFANADINTNPLSMPISVTANDSSGALLYQLPPPGTELTKVSSSVPVNEHGLKKNILKAEAYFQTSLNQLKRGLNTVLHSYVHPFRKKLLNTIQPEIEQWGHSTAWTMVRQVCRDAMLKESTGSSNWQNWLPWSQCTTTCGLEGYQIRHRDCRPDQECLGSNYDLRPCLHQHPCQDAPSWLGWTEWGPCSVTCGDGVQFRARTCVTVDSALACEGFGTEFSNCTLSTCASQNDEEGSSNLCSKHGHHPGKNSSHHHPHSHKENQKKKKKKNHGRNTHKPVKHTAPSAGQLLGRKRKRKARERGLTPPRRPRWLEQPAPDQLQGFQMLDSVMEELQGNEGVVEHRREPDMIPLQPLDKKKLLQHTLEQQKLPAAQQDLDLKSVSWSIWGLWSECSVSCDKGTEFRRRQCIRRKANSLDGEPVKSTLCFGKGKDRRSCALLPCPVSVSIPETLGQLSDGMEGHLTCRNQIKGQVHALYWIAPSGEIINSKSDKGRYTLKDNTLTIHNARKTDLGQYQCVLVGFGHTPPSPQSSNKTWSDGQSDKEDFGNCLENPCENGGICEDDHNGAHGQVAPYHFRCDCPEGFFGKRCEQKSLVHQYTPNLKIMGLVLVGMITLLFITCTCLCIYYWIESKRKGPLDMGPVMTRRRSEDQWRKMKSFDHKAHSRKQSFSTRAMKRLSRIWTGKLSQREEKMSAVRFGLNPDNEPTTRAGDTSSPNDIDELKNELTSGVGIKKFSSENLSQNASPPTLEEFESECESSPEQPGGQTYRRESPYLYKPQTSCKGTQKGSSAFQNSEEFDGEFQFSQRSPDSFQNEGLQDGQSPPAEDNSNHVIIKLQNSQLYVDFQGDPRHTRKCPSKQEHVEEKACVSSQHSQRQALQAPPRVIYSDDKMEMFSDSSGPHMQGLEERLKQQRYSPFLGSSGESLVDPVTYIYRSQMSMDPKDVDAPTTSSSFSCRSKRKRHSKKSVRQIRSVEHGFNQNNSDDSTDGNCQLFGEQEESEGTGTTASGSNHSPSPSDLHQASHSGHSSFSAERGHHSACQYSSTDSGEESETGQEGVCGKDTGARLRMGSRSCQKVRDFRSATNAADTRAKDSQMSLPRHPVCSGLSHHRQVTSNADGADTAKPAYLKYEVHHPDEPYPFRLARNTRKFRKGEDNTGTSSGTTEQSAQASSDNRTRRMQDSHSVPGSVPVPANVDSYQQRPSATSSQQLCYLEGGGEGASAQVHNELRKSGRDMLLRRAMENSYIQATTSHEPWRSPFPNKKQSGFSEGEQNETSNAPTRLQCHQSEQSVVSLKPESSTKHQLFSASASLSTTPSTSHGRRIEQQSFLAGMSQPSASVASGSHTVKHHSLPEGSTANDFSPQFQTNANTSQFGFPHQAYPADKSKVFDFATIVEASSDSSGPFYQRSCISEADSDTSAASGCNALFSNLNTARTPQVTRRPLPDRTAPMTVMRSPVHSPGEGGSVCRHHLISKTKKERNAQNQQLSNNRPSEPAINSHQTTSSTLQRKSSFGFEQRTKCQSKRVLKSALKQRCNQPKMILAEIKAQPARRVSFSEPYIHIRNSMDSMVDDNREWQHQRSSDVSVKTHHGATRAADDKPSREDQHMNNKQRLSAVTHIHRLSAAFPSAGCAEQVPIPVCCEENLNRMYTSSRRWTGNAQWNTFLTRRQGLAQQFSDNRQERTLGGSRHPATTSTNATGPRSPHTKASGGETSQSLSLSRPVAEMAKSPSGPQPQQPHILVDIEPDSSVQSHLHAQCDASMDRGKKTTAPPPQSSQGLLTPLIPQPAVKKPQQTGQQDRERQSDTEGGKGESSGRAEAAGTQWGGPEPSTGANLLGAMSFRSFQEMVAMRSPGAFFKPIDHTEKPPPPDK